MLCWSVVVLQSSIHGLACTFVIYSADKVSMFLVLLC